MFVCFKAVLSELIFCSGLKYIYKKLQVFVKSFVNDFGLLAFRVTLSDTCEIPETPEPRDGKKNRTENAEDGEMSVGRVMKKKLEDEKFEKAEGPKEARGKL